jgi:hypothetical protein
MAGVGILAKGRYGTFFPTFAQNARPAEVIQSPVGQAR